MSFIYAENEHSLATKVATLVLYTLQRRLGGRRKQRVFVW